MNDVLETNYDDRYIRVESGRTNLSVTGAVEEDGFFYAPDPSSQTGLCHRWQYRDEFRRCALPQIWRDHEQPDGA